MDSTDTGFPKAPDDSQYALRSIWEKEMGQSSIPVKHDKTAVLMLSWHPDDDDMHVEAEVSSVVRGSNHVQSDDQ